MADPNDSFLLREYAERHSESAFSKLVQRHLNFVYSVAMRYVGNPPDAQDVAQAVFVILAQKSAALCQRSILTGWLYETTRLTARQLLRAKARRFAREQEAYMQSTLDQSGGEQLWHQLAPHLEEAMSRLRAADRELLALRFYENKTGAEAAALMGIGAAAAHKRTNRALEKLQTFFAKRGVNSTAAAVAGEISAHSVQIAPVGLAKAISAVAVAKGATAPISTLTLIKGAVKIMAWTKAKTAIVTGAGLLFVAGTTTVTVKEIQDHRTYPWQVHPSGITEDQVNQPPQVRILRSKFKESNWAVLRGRMIGLGVRAQNVVASAYGYVTSARVLFSTELPAGRYDYIACLPDGMKANTTALQQEAKRKFGVVGRVETRNADVWLLKVKTPDSPGLKRSDRTPGNGFFTTATGFRGWHAAMSNLAYALEDKSNFPVIDDTGIGGRFDFDLNCTGADLETRNWDKVNQALDRLGLELVSTNLPLEMLVVEKAK